MSSMPGSNIPEQNPASSAGASAKAGEAFVTTLRVGKEQAMRESERPYVPVSGCSQSNQEKGSIMPRLLTVMLCLLALAWTNPAMATPDETAFTRDMAERFRAAMPNGEVQVTAPLQLRVGGDSDGTQVNLGRIHNFCVHAEAPDCEALMARFVATMAEAAADQDLIGAEQLRVAVRHTDFCDHMEREIGVSDSSVRLLTRPVAPQLCAVLMIDYPTRMRGLNARDLQTLGLEADSAWALAERQTFADLPQPDALEGLADNLIAVTDSDYVPSLLLIVEGWRRAAAAVGGEIVVAVPSDGLLVATRRTTITDLPGFQAVTRENFATAERGISPLVYRWEGSAWVVEE